MQDKTDPLSFHFSLVALDLDGTLLRNDKSISERAAKAVRAVEATGRYVAITTGRHPNSALRFFERMDALGPKSLAVCFNGSAVIDLCAFKKEGAPDSLFGSLWEDTADAQELALLDRETSAAGLDLHAYSKTNSLVLEKVTGYSTREIIHAKVAYTDRWNFKKGHESERYYKAVATGPKDLIDDFRPEISNKVRDSFEIMRTDDNFLEFIPHHNSKGSALIKLCSVLGVNIGECVAFGDAENDLVMIKNAGLGVAMGNAMDSLKKAADYVTLTNMQDGVAVVLEQLMREDN